MDAARRARCTAAVAMTAALAVAGCALAGCAPTPLQPAPSTALSTPAHTAASTPPASAAAGLWRRDGDPQVLAEGLDAPWSVVPLPGGGALISQRDDGRIRELTAPGRLREVGVVPGVVSGGEAGLNGLAVHRDGATTWLYAYHAAADDDRVVRMPLQGEPGALRLGPEEVILSGIAKADTHNGGRLAFGPDGMLYVTTGDAGVRPRSQDRNSLNGKILRITPAGDPAPGNPFGTAVYSYGHRNVQGIAWSADGTMWATEFGQDTWDELNVIVAGGNYGWPVVEGIAHDDRFRDPLAVWKPREASPSGLAAVGDTLFFASLRGKRLWTVDTSGAALKGKPQVALDGLGRLRDAVLAPDGALWVLTNNTDGRGDPRGGDDHLLRLPLTSAD